MTSTIDQTRAVPVTIAGPKTLRRDRWWVAPVVTVVVLGAFTIYGTWAALVNQDYYADPYLSPFYSPCLATNCRYSDLHLIGSWWHLSPALLVLPFPLTFRLTCYYYRKAYYRAFFWSPPACAVKDARVRYTGESRFPLILQNVHRIFFYLIIPFPIILLWDAIRAFDFPDGFGMGVGTLVLLANAVLLGTYVLSCHSCRHACGGRIDCLSEHPTRYGIWKFVTRLNERHMLIAWISLVGVASTDVYVRLVANGTIRDLRFF